MPALIADIVHGKTGAADVFFLIAAILFGLGALIAYNVKTYYATLMAAGLCLGFIGLLLL